MRLSCLCPSRDDIRIQAPWGLSVQGRAVPSALTWDHYLDSWQALGLLSFFQLKVTHMDESSHVFEYPENK